MGVRTKEQQAEIDALNGQTSRQAELDELNGSATAKAPGPSTMERIKGHLSRATPDFSPKGQAGAALRGFGQGEGYNFIDEARGLQGGADALERETGLPARLLAAPPGMAGLLGSATVNKQPGESSLDFIKRAYTSERDQARKEDAQALAAHPLTYSGGEMAGAVSSPQPFGKLGVGGRLAVGAGQGALGGLGASRGVSDAPTDVGIGAAAGLAGAGLGEGMQFAKGLFGKGVSYARDAIDARNRAAIAKLLQSKGGEAGGASQKVSRVLENVGRESPHVNIPLQAKANNWLSGPDANAMREHLVEKGIDRGPDLLKAAKAKQAELVLAQQAAPGQLASMNATSEASTVPGTVWKRFGPLITRGALASGGAALGAGIGETLDEPKVGAVVGGVIGGNPGTSRRAMNLIRDPEFALAAGKAGMKVAQATASAPTGATRTFAQWLEAQTEDAKDRLKNDR